jgi:eukaryotic-like serine/threonine-protein kinase
MLAPVEAAGIAEYARSRQPKRRRGAGFWAISGAVVLGLIAAVLLIGQFVLGGGSAARVVVPNLEGLTIESAQQLLIANHLTLGAQSAEVSDRPEGRIIAQQPASGETIEEGQAVNVSVSSGKEKATVPQLVGLSSVNDARTALLDANLQMGPITEADSDQPAGYVLSQSPLGGTQVNAGSTVAITIASGSVSVPQVVGQQEAQARSDIVQAGFDPQVIYQDTGTDTAGKVLAQSPQAGSKLDRGSVVTITVGRIASASAPPVTP